MAEINLKTLTPDTSLPTTGFLFGADSQATTDPSVYSTQTVATTLLGSTSLTGDTLTADAPVLNLTQTWNSSGITFTGMKFNAAGTSDANSAAASLLMDLQVNGSSLFSISKTGAARVSNGSSAVPSYSFGSATNTGFYLDGNGDVNLIPAGNTSRAMLFGGRPGSSFAGIFIGSAGSIVGARGLGYNTDSLYAFAGSASASTFVPFMAGTYYVNSTDTILTRKGAANIQLGAADAAAPVAQTLSVQSIVAGQTNASAAAYPFTITGAQGTGTGVGGNIVFKVAPAGGSGSAQNTLQTVLTIGQNGESTFTSVGNKAPINAIMSGGSEIATFLAPTLGAGGSAYISFGRNASDRNWAGFGFYYAGDASSSNAFTLAFYGTQNVWGVNANTTNTIMFLGGQTSSFPALKRSSTTLQARLADDSAFASVQGKLTTDTAYTAGTVVPTGYITIYDSTGTAYRVPCLV
jgi:hypothetical protein